MMKKTKTEKHAGTATEKLPDSFLRGTRQLASFF